MVKIKLIRNTYGGEAYLRNACKYSLQKESVNVDGYGVNPYNIDDTFMQMMAVKKYYRKTSRNPLIHIIISFDDCVDTVLDAIELSRKIVSYYTPQYQILWFVHRKDHGCSSYHMHMIINSVSYIDGRMFDSGIEKMNRFRNYVSELIGRKISLSFENRNDCE